MIFPYAAAAHRHATGPHTGYRRPRRLGAVTIGALLLLLLAGCSSWRTDGPSLSQDDESHGPRSHRANHGPSYRLRTRSGHQPVAKARGYREIGLASWYGSESGNRTASGARFHPEGLSAAHRTLPLWTRVRVTNLANGQSAVLVVNDRGPFVPGRIIDLSHGAARRLNMLRQGTSRVMVEALN
jgi:rare lipoprotein A